MSNHDKRKNEIVTKLQTIYQRLDLKPYELEWLIQAIKYIREET